MVRVERIPQGCVGRRGLDEGGLHPGPLQLDRQYLVQTPETVLRRSVCGIAREGNSPRHRPNVDHVPGPPRQHLGKERSYDIERPDDVRREMLFQTFGSGVDEWGETEHSRRIDQDVWSTADPFSDLLGEARNGCGGSYIGHQRVTTERFSGPTKIGLRSCDHRDPSSGSREGLRGGASDPPGRTGHQYRATRE